MTTTDDLDHWSLQKLEMVMGATQDANQSLKKLGDTLDGSRDSLWNWGGDAASTWRAQHGKIRTDIDAQGHQSQKVHDELAKVYPEVKKVKDDYVQFRQAAAQNGLTVSSPGVVSCDDSSRQADVEAAQTKLNGILQRATTVDEELADAIRTATTPQAPEQTPTPTPSPAPQPPPDQPKTDDNASPPAPGPHPGDTPYGQHDGKQLAATMEPHVDPRGSASVPLQDSPPGYDQNVGAGTQRDQNWRNYLQGINADGSHRTYGSMPLALPKPEAVQDKALRTVGAAGRQQGVSYAWGANKFTDSASPGHNATDAELRQLGATRQTDGSWINNDGARVGFDCGGLARFSVAQGTEGQIDLGGGTGNQFSHLQAGEGSAVKGPPLPGDLAYFGPGGGEHVAINVGNGVLIEARQSGEAVELLPTQVQGGQPQWMRPNY